MTTFGLIHGAGGTGSAFELLTEELSKRGHNAVSVDMPVGDPSAGATRYAQTLIDALVGIDDDVIVVGHSMGGLTAPVVAAMRPVAHLVFLGGVVPTPGVAFDDYLKEHPEVFQAPRPNGSVHAGPPSEPGWINPRPWEQAFEDLYHDCPPEVARRLWERQRRQSTTPRSENCPLQSWPAVPTTYILMTEDRAVNPAWSREIATERTGKAAVEIPGGHTPHVSRPALLADVLAGVGAGDD